MRGILSPSKECPFWSRIIPAHAGNTQCFRFHFCHNKDHPRSCGEYITINANQGQSMGSSPLMRGIPTTKSLCNWNDRIIPAHAGNTPMDERLTLLHEDHPRSCGEYFTTDFNELCDIGSSPLMRGIRCNFQIIGIGYRIIPAHAGNTLRFYFI